MQVPNYATRPLITLLKGLGAKRSSKNDTLRIPTATLIQAATDAHFLMRHVADPFRPLGSLPNARIRFDRASDGLRGVGSYGVKQLARCGHALALHHHDLKTLRAIQVPGGTAAQENGSFPLGGCGC